MQLKDLRIDFKIWQIFLNHMTMSLYSCRFYQGVYRNFTGYGVKHLIMCCFLASSINCIWLFSQCDSLLGYLKNNKRTAYSIYLNAIFNELPKIEYNGSSISSEEIARDSSFFIKSPKINENFYLLAINLSDKRNTTINSSLINLTKTKFILNAKNANTIEIPYSLITNTPITIDGPKLKKITTSYVQSIRRLFLYKSFPGIFIFNLYSILIQNIFLLASNALIVKFIFKRNVSHGIRPVVFAISSLMVVKSILQPFTQYASFVDYYSIITMLLTSIAIIVNERKLSYL
jgi:hypothetical protein